MRIAYAVPVLAMLVACRKKEAPMPKPVVEAIEAGVVAATPADAGRACTAAPAGGVMVSGKEVAFNHAIAAGPKGVLVTWLEKRRATDKFVGPEDARPLAAVARTADVSLALSAPRDVATQYAVDSMFNGVAPLASNGGLFAATCEWHAYAGKLDCSSKSMTDSRPDETWRTEVIVEGPVQDRLAGTAVGSAGALLLPGSNVYLFTSAGSKQGQSLASYPGDPRASDVPALVGAGSDRVLAVWRARGELFARYAGLDGRPHGATVPLSQRGMSYGAPAVAWSPDGAVIAHSVRASASAPWRLGLTRLPADAGPSMSTIATGAEPAVAPAIVASSAGCFVLSWTEGTGHGTVARAGRVCGGTLDAASVALVSRPGVEAGDTELATDGKHTFVVWQELPKDGPAHIRLARLSCD